MRLTNIQNKKQLLDIIEATIRENLPATQATLVAEFSAIYLEMLPLEEIQGRHLADIYGAVVACWQFLQHHEHAKPKLMVFNPDLEMHGWQSTHTVVAILHRNTPFIVDSVRMALNRLELKIYSIQHSVLYIERDGKGQLTRLRNRQEDHPRELGESLIFIEIDRHNDEEDLAHVHQN